MPYRSTDWKPARYRGQQLTGIKEHRSDETKFLFDVSLKKIRRKKIMYFEGSESERYQQAVKAYTEFRSEIYQGYFLEPVTFGDMFGRWISLKPDTRWTRLQRGVYENHIEKYLAGMNIRDVTAARIDAVMISVKSKAEQTRKRVIAIIRAVLTMALNEKIIKASPLENRHKVTVNAAAQKTLIVDAKERYTAVYKSIMTVFANDPKFRAIFLLGLNGRRKTEVLTLSWESISFTDETYVIRGTSSKIKQDLKFVIPRDVMAALEEIRGQRKRKPKGLIFPNPRTGKAYTDIRIQVQQIRDYSGWQDFGFHRMRNLTASALYADGVDAAHLSSILGHTSPGTLKQYLTMQRERSSEIIEEAVAKIVD